MHRSHSSWRSYLFLPRLLYPWYWREHRAGVLAMVTVLHPLLTNAQVTLQSFRAHRLQKLGKTNHKTVPHKKGLCKNPATELPRRESPSRNVLAACRAAINFPKNGPPRSRAWPSNRSVAEFESFVAKRHRRADSKSIRG